MGEKCLNFDSSPMVLLIDMILPREFIVYEDSQIFSTFFTFQIRLHIGLATTDANRRGKGKTFLIRAEDNKN